MTQHPDVQKDKESFYQEFTLRNAGFISDSEQHTLRQAHILIAGCGSTGGSVIEVLVRSGAENLALADNGSYELNNANRQNMVLTDVGRAKVDVFAERMLQINPHVAISCHAHGITPDNVDELVQWADIIVDAVDVTGRSGLEMKFLLHQVAQRQHKAVICGYDMAAVQYVPVFDYRDEQLARPDFHQLQLVAIGHRQPLAAPSLDHYQLIHTSHWQADTQAYRVLDCRSPALISAETSL